jgi:hypothetical protein
MMVSLDGDVRTEARSPDRAIIDAEGHRVAIGATDHA